jgi:hypothetical protein
MEKLREVSAWMIVLSFISIYVTGVYEFLKAYNQPFSYMLVVLITSGILYYLANAESKTR